MEALLTPALRADASEKLKRLHERPAIIRFAAVAYLLRLTKWMKCVKQEDGGDDSYAVTGRGTSKEQWRRYPTWLDPKIDGTQEIYGKETERYGERVEETFWSSARPLIGRTDGGATMERK